MSAIEFEQVQWVGCNPVYDFGVGLAGGRWVGFARGGGALFAFGEISEAHQLGLADRERAIRMTGAIAEDPEHAFGGVTHWLVTHDLRGEPDDFRCEFCGGVGCDEGCRLVYEEGSHANSF